MKKNTAILILFLLPAFGAFAQNLETFIRDSLDNYMAREMAAWDIPGTAVCVVKDGKVILAKGYGINQLGKPEKVDEHTLFLVASNSKAFTGTLMAMLAHENKCALDDKVQKWLPWFAMKDPWVTRELNLTDILTHRIGMQTFQGDFMYWTSSMTTRQCIEKFGLLTPQYSFRSRWGYTNLGYAIAGECIKEISGKTWAELLRERIFGPLEMNRSLALNAEFPKATNKAYPHTKVDGKLEILPLPNIDNLAPAGSIASSVNDLSHWVLAQLDNGNYQGKNVIPQDVIRQTRRPHSLVGRANYPGRRMHYRTYGLGWQLEDYEGREIISHTGGINGFVTSVTLVPEENLGVIVLTNTDANIFYEALKWQLIDQQLNLPYRNSSQFYMPYAQEDEKVKAEQHKLWRDTVNMNLQPALPLKSFTGRYQHEAYGYVNIARQNGVLKASFEYHPKLSATLEPLGGTRFLCTYSDPTMGVKVFPFYVENGKVTSFTLSVNDFVEYTTYDFIKENP
jgi:CubicO group peptidase (beta-lactamase class C family)